MNAIAEYRVAARDFVLGRAVDPGTSVEIERLIGEGDAAVKYFWVEGGSSTTFGRSLSADTPLVDLELLDEVGSKALFRCRCALDGDSLVRALTANDVTVLYGGGDDSEWRFRLGFPDRGTLSSFQDALVGSDGPALTLDGVYNQVEATTSFDSGLTDRQRETILTAYEEGYFDIPRKITLVDLAGLMGVSDQAVSERMRRGEAKLIRTHLLE